MGSFFIFRFFVFCKVRLGAVLLGFTEVRGGFFRFVVFRSLFFFGRILSFFMVVNYGFDLLRMKVEGDFGLGWREGMV